MVVQAIAVAVLACLGVRARAVLVGGVRVVVARCGIGATRDFKFIAHAIAIGIRQANTVAIIASVAMFPIP